MEPQPTLTQRLLRLADRHFAWLIIIAWVGVILFAPHGGNVGGWLLKWFLIGAMTAIAVTLALAGLAAVAGFIRRLI